MKLSDLAGGRDNNFNLLRIVAAALVIVSHSFALVLGPDAEPLRSRLGTTPGSIGVEIFFVTSGFLVTSSLLTRKDAGEFLWARILRIYPALLVMVVLTVFGLGLFFTTLSSADYFSARETWRYLVKNATLLADVTYTLPGVYDGLPAGNAVNGSLWSMPIEIRMYLILTFVWILARVIPAARAALFQSAIVVFAVGAAGLYLSSGHFPTQNESKFTQLFFMFFTGAAFYVLRARIVLSWPVFAVCGIALAVSSVEREAFFFVYNLTLAYVLLFLAYVPGGRIRTYNRLGDYSYGLYIYAFPIQQSVVALIPGVSVTQVMLLSSALTLAFAIASWHALEEHALRLKNRYHVWTGRLATLLRKP
jgi:peptidoglycan/LPS O-acetylase OafA/YrhL